MNRSLRKPYDLLTTRCGRTLAAGIGAGEHGPPGAVRGGRRICRDVDGPVLIGDIGGTNARFAVLPRPGAPLVPLPRVLTADFPGPVAAIRDALRESGAPRPRTAMLAVAARVESPVVDDQRALDGRRGRDRGRPRARPGHARQRLRADRGQPWRHCGRRTETSPIGPELPVAAGPKVVLGPGTGLGAAALAPVGEHLAVLPTEAGHVEFGPADDDEAAVWPGARAGPRPRDDGSRPVGAGSRAAAPCPRARRRPGLRPRHGKRHLRGRARRRRPSRGRDARSVRAPARAVRGRSRPDLRRHGWGLPGRRDRAAPPRRAVFRGFRTAFERKAPQDAFLRQIPTFVVTHPDPALAGLALLASQPGHVIYPRVDAP